MTDPVPLTPASLADNMTHAPIAHLVKLGRENSYITWQDILTVFPKPELELELVDRALASIITLGIPIRDEDAAHKP